MKKFLSLIVVLVTVLHVEAQIRFTEVGNRSGKNYIELYSPNTSANMGGYYLVSYVNTTNSSNPVPNMLAEIPLGSSSFTNTLSGTNLSDYYYILSQSAPVGGSGGAATDYTNTNQIYPGTFVSSNNQTAIFIVRNGVVEDFFVTQSSKAQAQFFIKSIPPATIDGKNIQFNKIQVSSLNYIQPNTGGANSYSLITLGNDCGYWSPVTPTPDNTNKIKSGSSFLGFDPGFIGFQSIMGINNSFYSEPLTLSSSDFDYIGNKVTLNLSYKISNYYDPRNGVSTTPDEASPELNIWIDEFINGGYDDFLDEAVDFNLTTSSNFSTTITKDNINSTTTEHIFNLSISCSLDEARSKFQDGRSIFFVFKTVTDKACFFQQNKAITPSALPVSLKYLNIKSTVSNIKLNWITSSEQNNKGFEVQKSVSSSQDFRTIGFVGTRAKDGNSNTEISYSFEDTDVKSGSMHYYRLKQIDFDGKFTYSPIKSIKPGSVESNLSVYPNPSQGSFTLTTGAVSGKVNVFLLDNTGRVINQYMNVSSSNTKFNNLKKGFYTLKIVDVETGEQSAQRVVVQ